MNVVLFQTPSQFYVSDSQTYRFLGTTHNPFLRMDSTSEEYSPYFARSSSKSTIDCSTELEKENWRQSTNASVTCSNTKLSSQELLPTSNPFISPNRLTMTPKRKAETREDASLKRMNLDRFMHPLHVSSV